MRISDWSSDVCSSDLPGDGGGVVAGARLARPPFGQQVHQGVVELHGALCIAVDGVHHVDQRADLDVDAGLLCHLAPRGRRDALAQTLPATGQRPLALARSEEHTSELQSLMRISYAVFCLKKQKKA